MTKQVLEKSDYVMDFHGGDLDENLRRYAYWADTGQSALDSISRGMVLLSDWTTSLSAQPEAGGEWRRHGVAAGAEYASQRLWWRRGTPGRRRRRISTFWCKGRSG